MSESPSVLAALRFAEALDKSNWEDSLSCLNENCSYGFRGDITHGSEAIISMYKTIGEWVLETFESVRYESSVDEISEDQARINFRDLLDHEGHHLDFRCQQLIRVGEDGRIIHIEHIDIEGEPEKVVQFNEKCKVKKPNMK